MEEQIERLNQQPTKELEYFQKIQLQKLYIDELLWQLKVAVQDRKNRDRKRHKLGKTYTKDEVWNIAWSMVGKITSGYHSKIGISKADLKEWFDKQVE